MYSIYLILLTLKYKELLNNVYYAFQVGRSDLTKLCMGTGMARFYLRIFKLYGSSNSSVGLFGTTFKCNDSLALIIKTHLPPGWRDCQLTTQHKLDWVTKSDHPLLLLVGICFLDMFINFWSDQWWRYHHYHNTVILPGTRSTP